MVIRGALVEAVANELMVVDAENFKVRKVAVVVKRYRAMASMAREGENCITTTIQPRCAMDE